MFNDHYNCRNADVKAVEDRTNWIKLKIPFPEQLFCLLAIIIAGAKDETVLKS